MWADWCICCFIFPSGFTAPICFANEQIFYCVLSSHLFAFNANILFWSACIGYRLNQSCCCLGHRHRHHCRRRESSDIVLWICFRNPRRAARSILYSIKKKTYRNSNSKRIESSHFVLYFYCCYFFLSTKLLNGEFNWLQKGSHRSWT